MDHSNHSDQSCDKIRLLLVDDEPLIRHGLAYLLGSLGDIQVVAEAGNGEEALALFRQYPIDVVLMDMRMPVMDGCTATKQMLAEHPTAKVLVLTTFRDDTYITQAIAHGAMGYLLKDSPPALIADGIRSVMKGSFVTDPSIIRDAVSTKRPRIAPADLGLIDRDLELMRLMADGLSNKEIGDRLYLTEGSVKNIITTLLSKLDLKDRTQIVAFAFRNGLVE